MRRIAIINQKGGVGKTTTTANLGAALARAGQRVLLIDLDPQGHLTLHFGAEVSPDQPTVYDVLTASTPVNDVTLSVRDNVTLVPADIDLAGAETELVSVMGREVLLREAVESYTGKYDVMLIDCPPSLGMLTINALVASSEVVIPLQAHFFGLQGLSKLLDTVMLVRQRINPSLTVGGIVLCMHESATRLAGEVTDDLRTFLEKARGGDSPWADAVLFKTVIRRNIRLAESSSFGQTVFDYAPRSNGAIDYATLAAEIFDGLVPPAASSAVAQSAAEPAGTGGGGEPPAAQRAAPEDGTANVAAVPEKPKNAVAAEDGSAMGTAVSKPKRRTNGSAKPKAKPAQVDNDKKRATEATQVVEAASGTSEATQPGHAVSTP